MNREIMTQCMRDGCTIEQVQEINDYIDNLEQENKQLKNKLAMQQDSNKLLCKAITCDDCNCTVCEAHKQQIRLEQQLKQRDEVIDKSYIRLQRLLDYYDHYKVLPPSLLDELIELHKDLDKYKGDSNE